MKKALSVLLSLLMVITLFSSNVIASFAYSTGDYDYDVVSYEEKTCRITKYKGSAVNLEIPSALDGYKVISIGFKAFFECTSLKSVTIPNSVVEIDDYSFKKCTSLESITIPDNVMHIAGAAFEDCTSLESITLPDTVMCIASSAFENTAYSNHANHWDNGVLYIGHHLIDTISEWDEYEETYKSIVPSYYKIKEGTITIAVCAFTGSIFLETVIIPDTVKIIGEGAFNACHSLKNITIPKSVTSIGDMAFCNCYSLKSIIIPSTVTNIDDHALGYHWNEYSHLVTFKDFIIYGYKGTAAEEYANDNEITFIELEKEPDITPAPTPVDPTPAPDNPTVSSGKTGDLNGDGKLSVVDAKWVLQSIAGARNLSDEQTAAADVNGDGKISVVDAKWILQIIAGLRDEIGDTSDKPAPDPEPAPIDGISVYPGSEVPDFGAYLGIYPIHFDEYEGMASYVYDNDGIIESELEEIIAGYIDLLYECDFEYYDDGYNEDGYYEMFFVNYDTDVMLLVMICDTHLVITYL